MSDIIFTTDYSGITVKPFSRANPFGGLSEKRHYQGGMDAKFKDTFFVLRGQKLLGGEPGWESICNFIEPDQGDKYGLLDYCMFLIPVAIKALLNLLLGLTWLMMIDQDSIILKILCGTILLLPSLAIMIGLQAISTALDLVKTVVALAITCLLTVPLLIPLNGYTSSVGWNTTKKAFANAKSKPTNTNSRVKFGAHRFELSHTKSDPINTDSKEKGLAVNKRN